MAFDVAVSKIVNPIPPEKIPRHIVVHEVGHLVVGIHLGIIDDRDGISFRAVNGNAAVTAWRRLNAPVEKRMLVDLAGILAHVIVAPETLNSRLQAAYNHSVLITPDHAHYSLLTADERNSVSGAWHDLKLANEAACELCPANRNKSQEALRQAECRVREIIVTRRSDIDRIADDVRSWTQESDWEFDEMMLYPACRALALL